MAVKSEKPRPQEKPNPAGFRKVSFGAIAHVAMDRSTGEPLTLGEMLPARDDDPATQACRRLDWDNLIEHLDAITKAVLVCLATCEELTSLAASVTRRLSASRSISRSARS